MFVFILCLGSLFHILESVGTIIRQMDSDLHSKNNTSIIMGIAITIIIYDFCFLFMFLIKLFIVHFWLMCQNMTFYEYVKQKWDRVPGKNPFNK